MVETGTQYTQEDQKIKIKESKGGELGYRKFNG